MNGLIPKKDLKKAIIKDSYYALALYFQGFIFNKFEINGCQIDPHNWGSIMEKKGLYL